MADSESKHLEMTETESNGIYASSQQQNPVETGSSSEGTRELTLTDHLNKRLLASYLQRLNESRPEASVVSSANENTDFDDDKPQTN